MRAFRFGAQVEEIRRDRVLMLYGGALALTHSLSMLFWRQTSAVGFLGRGAEAICWPLLPGCETLRVLTSHEVMWLLRGYFVLGLGVAALFAFRRTVALAYAGLGGLTLLKLLVLALDFRLRLNQHYMAMWISAVFLLLPGKRDAIRILLVLFYVWASTLKFNVDWVSGAALPRPLWLVPAGLISAACVYLIVLELVVSWGLLAESAWIFWGALAQFALFHAVSWGQVGFFFPSLMFLLLLIFPLARLLPRPGPPPWQAPSLLAALFRFELRPSTYGLVAGFSLLQLVPAIIPGDAAITGEGRPWALHMVDAPVQCRGWATVTRRDGSVVEVSLTGGTALRIACDPIVVTERARNICQGTSGLVQDATGLDLHLVARRRSEPALRPVIDLPGFCARHVRYDPFGHNEWIQIR